MRHTNDERVCGCASCKARRDTKPCPRCGEKWSKTHKCSVEARLSKLEERMDAVELDMEKILDDEVTIAGGAGDPPFA